MRNQRERKDENRAAGSLCRLRALAAAMAAVVVAAVAPQAALADDAGGSALPTAADLLPGATAGASARPGGALGSLLPTQSQAVDALLSLPAPATPQPAAEPTADAAPPVAEPAEQEPAELAAPAEPATSPPVQEPVDDTTRGAAAGTSAGEAEPAPPPAAEAVSGGAGDSGAPEETTPSIRVGAYLPLASQTPPPAQPAATAASDTITLVVPAVPDAEGGPPVDGEEAATAVTPTGTPAGRERPTRLPPTHAESRASVPRPAPARAGPATVARPTAVAGDVPFPATSARMAVTEPLPPAGVAARRAPPAEADDELRPIRDGSSLPGQPSDPSNAFSGSAGGVSMVALAVVAVLLMAGAPRWAARASAYVAPLRDCAFAVPPARPG